MLYMRYLRVILHGTGCVYPVDHKVNGILVQLPLPAHINERVILDSIAQHKDVDGLHPLNVAQLANTKTHAPGRSAWSFDNIDFHVSCTPQVCTIPLP
jgi:hypothetical protein